ncbi:hypothetical protein WUBG_08894, partial [Wuchereria bancrofti]
MLSRRRRTVVWVNDSSSEENGKSTGTSNFHNGAISELEMTCRRVGEVHVGIMVRDACRLNMKLLSFILRASKENFLHQKEMETTSSTAVVMGRAQFEYDE